MLLPSVSCLNAEVLNHTDIDLIVSPKMLPETASVSHTDPTPGPSSQTDPV